MVMASLAATAMTCANRKPRLVEAAASCVEHSFTALLRRTPVERNELSGAAAETTCPTTTETTVKEAFLLKDSRRPRPLQRLVGRLY